MNILIPGAGGPAGINLIKMLKKYKWNGDIISIDCDKYSSGFFLSDKYFIVPKTLEPSFDECVTNIIINNNIKIILPTNETTLKYFSSNKKKFKNINILYSDLNVINLCNDKWELFKYLNKNESLKNILPNTSDKLLTIFPQITKPKIGSGSRGFEIISNFSTKIYTNHIFQEFLPGTEITIDTLSNMEGHFIHSICRERISIKSGISMKGRVFYDDYLNNICKIICNFLHIKGPANIQFKKDGKNKWKLLEINPRFGGGTIFSYLAGIDIINYIYQITNKQDVILTDIIKHFEETVVLRYFEELIIKDKI